MPQRSIPELPPALQSDPVLEFYKRDVDRPLLRENLKLTPTQRAEKFAEFLRQVEAIRGQASKTPKQR